MRLERWYEGRLSDILVVHDHRNRCQVRRFLEDLTRNDRHEREKMDRLLELIADHGPRRNEERYKHVSGQVWEVKTHKVRILVCCFDRCMVLLEAGTKRTQKLDPNVLGRAQELVGLLPALLRKYLGRE